jgi:hypothetical protein
VALWSRMHECRDRLAVVGRLLAARVTAMSDITKCAGYIERDKSPRSPATWIAPKWLAHYLGARHGGVTAISHFQNGHGRHNLRSKGHRSKLIISLATLFI